MNFVDTFVVVFCVDHGVFGFEFDTPLNRLAIFIILGIGADDIFIVTGADQTTIFS